MLQFSYVQEIDFSKGVDQFNNTSTIPQGYCEDIVNMDPDGISLKKRPGYEKLGGDVPVPISEISVDSSNVATISLPSAINLDEVGSRPLWIQGRFSYNNVNYDVDFWASGFTSLSTYELTAGGADVSLNFISDLAISGHEAIIQTVDADSGEVIFLEEMAVNPSTSEALISYDIIDDINVRFITLECDEDYASADYGESGALTMAASTTITAAEHGLTNNLIPMFWQMISATEYKMILPDEFKIAVDGTLTIEFDTPETSNEWKLYLSACTNLVEGTAAPGTTVHERIIAGAETPYLIAACYVENIATEELSLVLPSSIEYDEVQEQHTVTFEHDGLGEFTNYKIMYAYGSVAAARCQIDNFTDSSGVAITTGGVSTNLTSLAVTGLNNEALEIKPSVNFIDRYQDKDETIIASGGQLYRSYDPSISESFDERNRIQTDLVIGPTFAKNNQERSQGQIVCSSTTSNGYLSVESILHTSGTTFTVTLLAPGYSAETSTGASEFLDNIITEHSELTILGSMKSRLNGTHPVVSVSDIDGDSILIEISISGATARDNDIESGARAGIFTDEVLFISDALFAADDVLTLNSLVDCAVLSVDSTNNNLVYVGFVENKVELFAGQRLGATSSRSRMTVTGSTKLVAGDIVEINGVTTRLTAVTELTASTIEFEFREAITISLSQLAIVCPLRWQLVLPPDAFLGSSPVSSTDLLKSVTGKGSLYISSGVKYDGDKVYTSGLPTFQIQGAININEAEPGLVISPAAVTATGAFVGGVFPVNSTDIAKLQVLDRVLLRTTTGATTTCDQKQIYTVTAIDTTANKITISPVPPSLGTTNVVSKFVVYRYFLRLSLLDRNGNLIVSASLGSQDLAVRLTSSCSVLLNGLVYPASVDPIDYANLTVEIFRRREEEAEITDYYQIGSVALDTESGYFEFIDATPDSSAEVETNKDRVRDPVTGAIGSTRSRMPSSASFITAINNQLVVGDYLGDNSIVQRIIGSAAYSTLRTEEFTLTTTSGSSALYVCENSDRTTVNGITGTPGTNFLLSVTTLPMNLSAGDIILVTRASGSGLKYRPTYIGWWTVASVNTDIPGDHKITVTWSGAPDAIAPEDYAGLVLYFKEGKIPLASDLLYAPNSGSFESDTTIRAGLSLHLSQCINRVFSSVGLRAFGGKEQFEEALTISGDSLVSFTAPDVDGVTVYSNGRVDALTATARQLRYGSRLALSIQGYPEVFDYVETTASQSLTLVQDVNPDDGERVRMAIPFFASSAFGAAQQSNVLLIFKQHSAYLLDPQAKYQGLKDFFKQIDTSGYGCEAPLGVVNSQLGVFFANTTGIYLINRQFQFTRIGISIGGYISGGTFSPNESTAAVIDIAAEKLMFTSGDSTLAFRLPESEQGSFAWTRYENIPATQWAHRNNSAIFATAEGFIGIFPETVRYADAGAAIPTTILLRHMDGGAPTLKKVLRHIYLVLSAETSYAAGDIDVEVATDFSNVFSACDTFKLTGNIDTVVDGLSDVIRPSIQITAFSPPTAKAAWYQLKLSTNKLDAGLILARVIYEMAGMRTRGAQSAAETK